MISSVITAVGREVIERAAMKRARNLRFARAHRGFPPLRSSRPSCEPHRPTWTADSSPMGELFIDYEKVADVTGFSCVREPVHGISGVLDPSETETDSVYQDIESLYPEVTEYLNSGTKKTCGWL